MDSFIQKQLFFRDLTISTLIMAKGREDFAFTEEGIFCHCTAVVGTKTPLKEIKEKVVVKFHDTAKGYAASWLCPLSLIDEKTKAIIAEAEAAAEVDRIQAKAWEEDRKVFAKALTEQKAEAEAKEKEIKSLVGEYKEIIKEDTPCYGGSKYLEFIFIQKTIDKETFKKFLSLKGLVVEPKPCYCPISPERVEFYSINSGWVYKWHGEWSD